MYIHLYIYIYIYILRERHQKSMESRPRVCERLRVSGCKGPLARLNGDYWPAEVVRGARAPAAYALPGNAGCNVIKDYL